MTSIGTIWLVAREVPFLGQLSVSVIQASEIRCIAMTVVYAKKKTYR